MRKKFKKSLISLAIILFIVVTSAYIFLRTETLTSFLRSYLNTYPYWTSFISSFFSTISVLIPFFSYPFYAIMVTLLTGDFGNIFLIVILMGAGSTLGDLLSYSLTYFPSLQFLNNRQYDHLDKKLENWKEKILKPFEKRGIDMRETWVIDFLLAFIFGLFPLPDDLLMLYFGFRRRNLKPILLGNWIGRIIMYLLIYLGLFSVSYFFL